MVSLNLFIPPVVIPQRRVHAAATTAKGSGGVGEEKSVLDFILGSLTKQDQFYETDPILKKVEKTGGSGTTSSGRKSSVVVPPPKNPKGAAFGGFAAFFSKKD